MEAALMLQLDLLAIEGVRLCPACRGVLMPCACSRDLVDAHIPLVGRRRQVEWLHVLGGGQPLRAEELHLARVSLMLLARMLRP